MTEPAHPKIDCPKCSGAMTIGIALVGAPRGITYEGKWPPSLQGCLKCTSCGHSETLPYPPKS